ncbi:helix-turn-helix domain protein [Clostridium sp. DL-VIII]|uniref:helix-turn-helix domain-containing protein n=1 Tax=Clostridium sp. DL-VIII TaxID=641107 RepID=UPI00023AFCE8|nr:helix-turn-helix domain-containing protein [Clostridium sp. DL-VIII]EHI99575.1 helix-turn-helix domain protein [Clostridium sp. DL-VIII]
MNKEKFGDFVCKLRKEKGMTQQELGDKLHLTNKAISKWERGLSFPDICMLQDIAEILEVSVLELLNGERNAEINISSEVANRIVVDTVKHSGQLIKKSRRKLTVAMGLTISLLPIVVMFFSGICFYFLKYERSLDDALLTFIFLFIAAALIFIMCGVPLAGVMFTNMWNASNLMNNNKRVKKIICVALYLIFGIWLAITGIRVINNIL